MANRLLCISFCCVLAGIVGCRIGGPTEEADLSPIQWVDAAADAGSDASLVSDVGSQADTGAEAAVDAPPSGPCSPPFTPKVCDPVCNKGCTGLDRCNVSDNPQEGKCIGSWIQGEGSGCIKTATTDPCAATLSCVEGKCMRLCYNDADCTEAAGKCCKKSIDVNGTASGFKACVPCSP